jgi:hypothetical protein
MPKLRGITNAPAQISWGAANDVATTLLEHRGDVRALRPFKDGKGRSRLTVTVNGKRKTFITNAPATLRRDEWKMIDRTVVEAVYTTPVRMFNDLRSSSTPIVIPGGMGKTVLEYEKMSDIGPATVSMDGIRESDMDRPYFELAGMPLPIIHKDFQFTTRSIQVSREGGTPLDMSMPRLATRKCLEEVEKFTAGSQTYKYAGYNLYGYTNFPQRMTQSLTAPSSSNHATTVTEIISMRKKLIDKGYTGPFVLYTSPAWDSYLDEDYSTAKGDNTFRDRILALDNIAAIRTSYWLTGNAMVMVQLTPDVAQAVVGMEVVTVQWPSHGGMLTNFKVMCILLPRLKADINGVTGIVHGS